MEANQDLKEDTLSKGFKEQIDSLEEVYQKSTLKEKHRLNEHIKHLIKTYGDQDTQFIEKDLK